MKAIIGLLHADMHPVGTVGSLCHLATCVITVAPGDKGDETVVKITKRSKSGKVIQDVSIFSSGEFSEKCRLCLNCFCHLGFFSRRRF